MEPELDNNVFVKKDTPTNKLTDVIEYNKIFNDVTIVNNDNINDDPTTNVEQADSVDNTINVQSYQFSDLCRLCMTENNAMLSIHTSMDGFDVPIVEIIRRCLPAVTIYKNEKLSKNICTICWDVLKPYNEFRERCVRMDRFQKKLLRARTLSMKNDQTNLPTIKKVKADNDPDWNAKATNKRTHAAQAHTNQTKNSTANVTVATPENIVIEIVDEECFVPEDVPDKCKNFQSHKIHKSSRNDSMAIDRLDLPKDIRVSVANKPVSKVGIMQAQIFKGLFNHEFCLADNYLFELRLFKGTTRLLRCLEKGCTAMAQQKLVSNKVDNVILVKEPHNHPPPNHTTKRRQMLVYAINKRMQADKTANFKGVYDSLVERDPDLGTKIPLASIVKEICASQWEQCLPSIYSFEHFFDNVESDVFQKLHYTLGNNQFYQDKFSAEDGSMCLAFANKKSINMSNRSENFLYIDCSFETLSMDPFPYHLLTVLVWSNETFRPIVWCLLNKKSLLIYRIFFNFLRDTLIPEITPTEIVTDYEANLYYAISETYPNAQVGGSMFYYVENLYKKVCHLDLSRCLEVDPLFRNIYHMLLMLPLLPVNTITDAFANIEQQAREANLMCVSNFAKLLEYVNDVWLNQVTPDLFCVHKLPNRINETVVPPFKKLRDMLMLTKGKKQNNIVSLVEKIIELENFVRLYANTMKNSDSDKADKSLKRYTNRDVSNQKRIILKAWQHIEEHPKININAFFGKVLQYIKCMENQLWIWGLYRYQGHCDDTLINAQNFSIITNVEGVPITENKSLQDIILDLDTNEPTTNANIPALNEVCADILRTIPDCEPFDPSISSANSEATHKTELFGTNNDSIVIATNENLVEL